MTDEVGHSEEASYEEVQDHKSTCKVEWTISSFLLSSVLDRILSFQPSYSGDGIS